MRRDPSTAVTELVWRSSSTVHLPGPAGQLQHIADGRKAVEASHEQLLGEDVADLPAVLVGTDVVVVPLRRQQRLVLVRHVHRA